MFASKRHPTIVDGHVTDSVTLEAAIIAAEVLLTIVDELRLSVSNKTYCETQQFTDQKLSSSIFACCSFVPSRIGNISTSGRRKKKTGKKWSG